MHKVFFSWQSDTEPKAGLLLVREALGQAIQRLNLDLELDEATRNQPGSQILARSQLRNAGQGTLMGHSAYQPCAQIHRLGATRACKRRGQLPAGSELHEEQ